LFAESGGKHGNLQHCSQLKIMKGVQTGLDTVRAKEIRTKKLILRKRIYMKIIKKTICVHVILT
jgi:hypothetical protein